MYSFLAMCLIFGLATARTRVHKCKDIKEYPSITKGWKELFDQYRDYLDDTQSDNITKCINDSKIPLMDAINHCQMDFKQPNVTIVRFIENICQSDVVRSDVDLEDIFCCVTDHLLQAGADNQSVERASVYTKCLDKYLLKNN